MVSAASLLVVLVLVSAASTLSTSDHIEERKKILKEEAALELGGNIELSPVELTANSIVMAAKYAEMDHGFQNVSEFNPASHFFLRKKHIEASPVFSFIRTMPKGAALHVHDTALIGGDYLIKNITYRDNLYICSSGESVQLLFAQSPPQSETCVFQLLKNVREASSDVNAFDADLAKHFTLEVDDPSVFTDIDMVWERFGNVFGTITPMLTYKPVWEDYFYEALRQYREDKVMYVELRTTLPPLYDLDGNTFDSFECARSYKKVNDRFVGDFPDFIGSKIIFAPIRAVKPSDVQEYVEIAKAVKSDLGDYLAGFDLVGQEDKGKPLEEFLDQLLTLPASINVFYHAGETNWYGTSTDYNLVDAVLLGAKRLGHAYALLKHPAVCRLVREKQVAIEVNPVSNQVLMLVEDMRNHPASLMLAENYPVVISSDDPGLWGALPLSHDFYQAFMGLASRHADLRLLKQLALNSIKFSSMSPDQSQAALSKFNQQWNSFIQSVITHSKVIPTVIDLRRHNL